MTDREFLELAAKAAGVDLFSWSEISQAYRTKTPMQHWNPLTDDGDALRLAVKCGIKVELHPAWVYARAVLPKTHHAANYMEITEGWADGSDPYAATRRAIVRAAAEIGKAMT